SADADTNGVFVMYSADLKSGAITKLHRDRNPGQNTEDPAFDKKGKTAYFPSNVTGAHELFRTSIKAPSPIIVNDQLHAQGDVWDFKFAGKGVVYRADQNTNDVRELYYVDLKSNESTSLNGPLVAGGNVTHYEVDAKGKK